MSEEMNNNNSSKEEIVNDEYVYTPRNRERNKKQVKEKNKQTKVNKEKKETKFNKLFVIIPCSVILLLIVFVLGYTMTLPKTKIADGIYINNVNVGGMTENEAKDAISDIFDAETVFEIVSGEHKTNISATEIDFSVDEDKTVSNAMIIGKRNNIFFNAIDAVSLLFGDKHIGFVPKYNVEKLDTLLFDFGATFNGNSAEQEYTYTEDSMTITPGTPGQNHDVSVARNEFIKAASTGNINNILVTLDYAEPVKLNADEVYNQICRPSEDAKFERNENGDIVVREHVVGVEVNKENLKNAIEKVNLGMSATTPAKVTMPDVTKEELEENLFNHTLGEYTTDFSTSSQNRAYNVELAAKAINNVILMPGEVFSYNDTIGNPSLKNGYKVAPIFENGKTAQGVGGGVCQVSSTLYSAVLFSDLKVVERKNHSLTVTYVPKGQDATVAYGIIDFKFENSTNYPIKINSYVTGRKLTVSIIGGKYEPERKVQISHSIVSTIAPTETEIVDETLAINKRKVQSKGKTGYIVDTYKTVYENGVKKSSEKITRSTYKMVPTEVLVGKKEVSTIAPQVPGMEGIENPENQDEGLNGESSDVTNEQDTKTDSDESNGPDGIIVPGIEYKEYDE